MNVVFERNGKKSFESMNEIFDPELHQLSLTRIAMKIRVIIEEMQKGYNGGKVIKTSNGNCLKRS